MTLTVKQSATRLGVSKSLIYQLCAVGRLPHYRVGVGRGTIRIDERDLEALKLAYTQGTAQPALPLQHLAMNGAALKVQR